MSVITLYDLSIRKGLPIFLRVVIWIKIYSISRFSFCTVNVYQTYHSNKMKYTMLYFLQTIIKNIALKYCRLFYYTLYLY